MGTVRHITGELDQRKAADAERHEQAFYAAGRRAFLDGIQQQNVGFKFNPKGDAQSCAVAMNEIAKRFRPPLQQEFIHSFRKIMLNGSGNAGNHIIKQMSQKHDNLQRKYIEGAAAEIASALRGSMDAQLAGSGEDMANNLHTDHVRQNLEALLVKAIQEQWPAKEKGGRG